MVLDIVDFRAQYERRIKLSEALKYTTWCLLVFVDGEIVRSELSKPTGFSGSTYTEWEERIILSGSEGDPINIVIPDDDDGFSPEFPIEVRRR